VNGRINLGLDRFSGLYLLAIFIVVFGILSPAQFLTMTTFHVIASQQAVAGMIAIALLIPMVCGHFDLSVGVNANMCGMIAVVMMNDHGFSVIAALLLGVATGLVVGAVNGFVVVKLGVSSFIATLGMSSLLLAVQSIVTDSKTPLPPASDFWGKLTQVEFLGFQIIIVYLVVLALIVGWVLTMTPLGRYMYSTGSNPDAARLSGIRTDLWSWLSLTASGGISALAGVLFVSLTGPTLSFGNSMLLPAFAAVFLGSTQLKPGRFNVAGTLLAIIVLAVGVEGLQIVSGIQWVKDAFNGLALIIAVALAVGRTRRGPRAPKRPGKQDATSPTERSPIDVDDVSKAEVVPSPQA
jgi:ribose transport system permease protein